MNVFLEIKNIKKHFGEGESRVEVLKGIDPLQKKALGLYLPDVQPYT